MGLIQTFKEWAHEKAAPFLRATPRSFRPGTRSSLNQTDRLVELMSDAELCHTALGEAYAALSIGGVRQVWAIDSPTFGSLLRQRFYEQARSAPRASSLSDALGTLKAKAQFDGPLCEIHTRVAEHDGKIYLDLADDDWRVVEISAEDWQVTNQQPLRFRRSSGMLSLPCPAREGSLEQLRECINAPDEQTWVLCVSWLLGAIYPSGPYPLLILQGEQGSSKSTTARILTELVDPREAALRTPPRSEQDLMISALNGWLVAFDNLSRVPGWLSDALCRLSTGGGFSTRQLYTNKEESVIEAMRPTILTGIAQLAVRDDLIDRAIILNLPPIGETQRRTATELKEHFDQARPQILGALCTALSTALRNLNNVQLPSLPRMADFAKLIVAAEPALPWERETFWRVYRSHRRQAFSASVACNPVASAVLRFAEEGDDWSGNATELLTELQRRGTGDAGLPRAANWLSNRLREAATVLRAEGVEVEFGRSSDSRGIRIRRIRNLDRNDGEPGASE